MNNTIKPNPPVLPQQSSPFSGHRRLVRLSPDSEYEVRLRGRNRFGWAEEEAKFRFNTSRNGERRATPGSVFFWVNSAIRVTISQLRGEFFFLGGGMQGN